jgi:3',5'-cyclic AMP phosphodiesterase CpdA
MLIAHISDLHIAAVGKKAYGKVPTANNLTLCIDHINQLQPAVDLVLVTGDITYTGLQSEAKLAAELLENLNAPYYIIPGNHDTREVLRSAFEQQRCPVDDGDFINYIVDGFPLYFIALDTTVPGEPGGEICTERAAWLEEQLEKAVGKPTIIIIHHPPVKCGVLETDEDGFVGADLLGNIVEKYPNIERILCGHIHLTTHVRWRGTVVSTAASMGLQLLLDLTLKLPSSFYNDAPCYQLHYWSPDQQLISHTVSLHEMEGPFLF